MSAKATKALILVGGFGTRLRPLTYTMPKPLIPFGNLPMIVHQLIALRNVGVDTVILAVAYRPELMEAAMNVWAEKLGMKIIYSIEDVPLGTAGPLALAEKHLLDGDAPFFVLNSDVTCAFDLQSLLNTHVSTGAEATIAVTRVADPSRFGVVVFDEATKKVDRFVEKPSVFVGDCINAGIYVINPAVLARVPRVGGVVGGAPVPTSIERVVFPAIAGDGRLFAHTMPGFWMDLGKPSDFVDGLSMFLAHVTSTPACAGGASALGVSGSVVVSESDADAATRAYKVVGRAVVHSTATIAAGAVIGPDAAIGAGATVGPYARVARAAVLDGATVDAAAYVEQSIVGPAAKVGAWARVTDRCVIGASSTVASGVALAAVHAAPQIEVGASYGRLPDGTVRVIEC